MGETTKQWDCQHGGCSVQQKLLSFHGQLLPEKKSLRRMSEGSRCLEMVEDCFPSAGRCRELTSQGKWIPKSPVHGDEENMVRNQAPCWKWQISFDWYDWERGRQWWNEKRKVIWTKQQTRKRFLPAALLLVIRKINYVCQDQRNINSKNECMKWCNENDSNPSCMTYKKHQSNPHPLSFATKDLLFHIIFWKFLPLKF